jgi:hypothetical protein
MTNLELDEIESILTITSQVISKQMKWMMWYNKKNIYNTTTVGRGSHYFDENEVFKLFAQNQMKENLLFNV